MATEYITKQEVRTALLQRAWKPNEWHDIKSLISSIQPADVRPVVRGGSDLLERPDYFHDSPKVCTNKLFNMIQRCRVEVSIMQSKAEFNDITDMDLVKVTNDLAKSVREVFSNKMNEINITEFYEEVD